MITALDTNVLLDVFLADRQHGKPSRSMLARCMEDGGLVACEVVWAEVATFFPDAGDAKKAMDHLGVRFLIGAHALRHADRLLSRDRGFYRRAFDGLTVIEPGPS